MSGLTASNTMCTTGVAVCADELGVSTSLPETTVDDEGNLHAMEADLSETGDGNRLRPIRVCICKYKENRKTY